MVVMAACNGWLANRMRVVSVHAVLPPAGPADPLHLSPLAARDILPKLCMRVEAIEVGVLGHIAAQELCEEGESF